MGSRGKARVWPQHSAAYIDLAEKLRQWRRDAGLSQSALAKKLRVPESWVGKCERRDRRIDPVEFVRWCKACGVDPSAAIKAIGAV